MDSEYTQRSGAALTNCTGSEIVGIWVSRLSTNPIVDLHQTILFKPDGTGRARIKTSPLNFGVAYEWKLRWHYAGNGNWEVTGKQPNADESKPPGLMEPRFSVRYTGMELLLKMHMRSPLGNTNTMSSVYVRADDEIAVAEHLKKR